MAQLDVILTSFLSGSNIGRDALNNGQNENYFRIETAPSGTQTVMQYVNGNVVQGHFDAQEMIETDWSIVT